ncbi:MAG: TMEM165/GDT1 family protein [Halieaceae bacterium]|jgi:putative Ca2+/H+ antiporter (TMEM165/GDT1 family)|nr:TMEM165/GDT1 family protein [Halieaceae bacterium]
MEWKTFLIVFGTVFAAELGDKTQLATLLFASSEDVGKWTVFFAASLALVAAAGIGVLAGALLGELINPRYLQYFAGVAFIAIGIFTLYTGLPANA